MGSAVLANGLQTQIRADVPTGNFDHLTYGYLRNSTGGLIQLETYFTRPFPLKATITSATLYLYSGATAQTGSVAISARRIKTAFSFTKVTWNTRPTTYYTPAHSTTKTGPIAGGTEWAIDVTAAMQSVSLGEAWYGWDIYSTSLNPALAIYGPTHSLTQYRPRLEVEWSDEPDQPRTLSPSGGRAVSVAKPTLRCDYVDVSGDTSMNAMHVQTSSTSSFTAPIFDSGIVIKETPELDLSLTTSRTASVNTTNGSTTVTAVTGTFGSGDVGATISGPGIPGGATITAFTFTTTVTISVAATASATNVQAAIGAGFAGINDNQVIYWRVRVQDGAGLWSEWSDPVDFKRDGKGALTLVNPSSGTPIVEETTPPFDWTFTGETQSAYQLTIIETNTLGQVKQWTTGKKTSTATSLTIPAGVIRSPDSTYSANLRVWDTKQRESIAGDPAYVEVVRAFTYVPTATVTATTSPTAVGQTPYPRVLVGWQRATDPDSFTILRNRQVIAANLLPSEVRVSGSTFSYLDKSAHPFTTLTYEVQAVVNGKASASNPTAVTTLQHQGMWLSNTDHSISVLITGRDDRAVTYGEDSEIVLPVGATEPALVTNSLRGLEGTLTGELHSNMLGLSTTAQQWRDAFLRIKAQAGRTCWLTFGDRTIQCVIRNAVVAPRPTTPLSFKVSFEFYQTGTLEFTPSL